MKNKYYEPDIDDFFVGMIYETEQDEERGLWEINEIESLRELEELCRYNSKYIGKYSNIRIKYLDKEDIESIGFKIDETHNSLMSSKIPEQIDYMFYSRNYGSEYKLLYCNWWTTVASSKEELDGKITIDNIDEHRLVRIQRRVSSKDEYSTIFSGNIKNKSELKRTLKMIGYDENL